MSQQAIANPDDLERFARELLQFNAQLGESVHRLNGQFSRLGETWRDQEHQKFAAEYQQTVRVLDHFMRAAEQQAPLLQRKAAVIRQYLNQS